MFGRQFMFTGDPLTTNNAILVGAVVVAVLGQQVLDPRLAFKPMSVLRVHRGYLGARRVEEPAIIRRVVVREIPRERQEMFGVTGSR